MEDKNRKRAIRRAHYQRLKKNVKWYYGGYFDTWRHYPNEPETCGFLANTQTKCSCWMCGNPRRYYKWTGENPRTIQEQKVYQESIEEILRSYEE